MLGMSFLQPTYSLVATWGYTKKQWRVHFLPISYWMWLVGNSVWNTFGADIHRSFNFFGITSERSLCYKMVLGLTEHWSETRPTWRPLPTLQPFKRENEYCLGLFSLYTPDDRTPLRADLYRSLSIGLLHPIRQKYTAMCTMFARVSFRMWVSLWN